MSQLSSQEETWVEVAQAFGQMEAEFLASAVRSVGIPVYLESMHGMESFLGNLATPFTLYVPERFYDDALELLYAETDEMTLDEPGLRLGGQEDDSQLDSD
jgi:hypothetical protein